MEEYRQASLDAWAADEEAGRPAEPRRLLTIEERFERFHAENPGVYDEIVRLSRIAKRRGHRRYSVDLILAVVRFRRDMRLPAVRDGSGFKLNNNLTSRYSRLVQQQERCSAECAGCESADCLAGFFETRELRSA